VIIKHIYWFTYYGSVSPSTRSRGEHPLQVLREKYHITNSIVYPGYGLNNILHFLSVYLNVLFFRKPGSLLVIQKIYSNRLYANALKILIMIRKKHTLYDLDDAEYLRHPVKSLHFFLKNCATVSVSSKALEKSALQFNNHVLLNTSPVENHSYIKSGMSDKLTLGWVGDYGNGNDLSYEFSHKRGLNELVFPVLKELSIPFRFVLIGISKVQDIRTIREYFSGMDNMEFIIPENVDWRDEDWLYGEISRFDIGLAPLIDHEFNRAKSAYKVKQYLSCGVPVLASDVGENANFVFNGMNGFLCDSPGDYGRKIDYIAGMNKEKYCEMSGNAYRSSHSFRTEKYCDELIDYFQVNR
jgi:glycosyltransferase involved in cell wall biosynthesis